MFNDQSFNNTLTNDIFSFEQLGPDKKEEVDHWHDTHCTLNNIFHQKKKKKKKKKKNHDTNWCQK